MPRFLGNLPDIKVCRSLGGRAVDASLGVLYGNIGHNNDHELATVTTEDPNMLIFKQWH